MSTCRCGLPAVVQWQRRPTEAEIGPVAAVEEIRREAAAARNERVTEAPLPSVADSTIAVYACVDHAISPDLAARIHKATCSGLVKEAACDCTPEPVDDVFPTPDSQPDLPPGW